MNCVAIIFLAYSAINSGSSSALSEISVSPSKKNHTAEEFGTCPMNSSISVKVFRNLKGEWLTTFVDGNKLRNFTRSMDLMEPRKERWNLEKNVLECGDSRYITISGFLKETDAGNTSDATVGDYRNNTDGESNGSCKRSIESPTTADLIFMNKTLQENLMEARKSSDRMKTMEDRMTSVENTLTTINGTLTIIKESHAYFENTLKAIEETVNQLNTMLKCTRSCGYPIKLDTEYKGKNIRLTNDFRSAKRMQPIDDSGYAGVVSNFPLEEEEVFRIRIDETMGKWSSYGIAIGVIAEKKEGIKDAWNTLWNSNINGTWAIYSHYDSQSGKSNTYKDGDVITSNGYPLSTKYLPVGTLLGISRRCNGKLHFYLNGVDKGPAFGDVPKDVYAFVDVLHYVTKISIMN